MKYVVSTSHTKTKIEAANLIAAIEVMMHYGYPVDSIVSITKVSALTELSEPDNTWIKLEAIGPAGVGKTTLLELLKPRMDSLGIIWQKPVGQEHVLYVREDTVKRLQAKPPLHDLMANAAEKPHMLTYTARLNAVERNATALREHSTAGSVLHTFAGYVLDLVALLRDLKP